MFRVDTVMDVIFVDCLKEIDQKRGCINIHRQTSIASEITAFIILGRYSSSMSRVIWALKSGLKTQVIGSVSRSISYEKQERPPA